MRSRVIWELTASVLLALGAGRTTGITSAISTSCRIEGLPLEAVAQPDVHAKARTETIGVKLEHQI
jgi:hypothetical protein